MVRLLILRHGVSLTNKDKRYTGKMDVPLAPLGYEQAEVACRFIAENYRVDAVYASDLSRATNTVRPLAERLSLPLLLRRELREIDLGDWEGKTYEEVKVLYPETWERLHKERHLVRYEGGESFGEAYERAKRAFLSIARENEGKTAVVASHGGTIRLFLAFVLGLPFEKSSDAPLIPNASLSLVEINGEDMRLRFAGEDGYLKDLTLELDGNLH